MTSCENGPPERYGYGPVDLSNIDERDRFQSSDSSSNHELAGLVSLPAHWTADDTILIGG